MTTPHKEICDRIESRVRKACYSKANRRFERADFGRKLYRKKVMFWVGYQWVRPGAHHFNGIVYDSAVAWGMTLEEAIAKLEQKVPLS